MVCRTSCGREFQMAGPDTEKPRRPNRIVSALVTTRSPRLADRRLRRPALEETAMQSSCMEVSRGGADQAVPNEEADLELGPEANWDPMKLVSNADRDMGELWYLQDDPRRCIQDGLETVELEPAGTVEDTVAIIVDPIADEAVREHENRFLRERVANRMQTTQLEKTGTT